MVTFGPAFAAAVRMIDRVFGDTSGSRTKPQPTHPARFAPRDIFLISVADLTNRCPALR